MSDNRCPSIEVLTALSLGKLSEAELSDVAPHVESCDGCQEKLSRIELEATHNRLKDRFRGAQAEKTVIQPGKKADSNRVAEPPRGPATNRFKVLRPHARGGLGEVFVAEDAELPREVALKQIQSRHADDADSRARFLQEAAITGALEHPNIVPVYGLGHHADGRPYYAMRFIRGDSLKQAVDRYYAQAASRTKRSQVLEFRKLLQRFIDVCNAVDYAHSRGVLHRDLKPSNVMLGKFGETLVVDWGLAKLMSGSDGWQSGDDDKTTVFAEEGPIGSSSSGNASPTQMGTALGTPQYMSPEQAAGRLDKLGPTSDVYSLGATLYYILTGRAALTGEDQGDVLQRVQRGDVKPPRQVNHRIDKSLDAVCRKAMALKPAERYPSARALADDLERWMADEPVAAKKESALGRVGRWTRKNRTWTLTGVVGLVAVAVVSAGAAVAIQNSKVNEVRALRITAASDNFGRGLEVEQWNDAHLQHMEGQLADLQELGYPNIGELQERLIGAYSQNILRRLRAATITADDVAAVERQLAWLDARKPAVAEELRRSFLERLTIWEPVFELKAPYSTLADVFDSADITTAKAGLTFKPADAKKPYANSIVGADGNVQLHAVFGPEWEQQPSLGLAFRNPEGGGYEFVLTSSAAAGFAAARRTGGELFVEIRRNGATLQRREIAVEAIEAGSLRLTAERIRETISVQINAAARVEAYDPFPLSSRDLQFAVVWPANTSLVELRGLRQGSPAKPSTLEIADRHYDAGDFQAALSAYQLAASQTEIAEVREESLCKQGLCLAALNRPDEAIGTFAKAAVEPGPRWSGLAGLHLWFLLERQSRAAEADSAFDNLTTKYRSEQLAAIIPHDLRMQLFTAQQKQFDNITAFSSFDDLRLKKMEQIAAIDRLLSSDGKGQAAVQLNLLRAYKYSDDIPRALPLAERMLRERPDATLLRNYVRALCWTGNPQQAVVEATNFLTPKPGVRSFGRHELNDARMCRARALVACDKWAEAEIDVDEVLRLSDDDPNHASQAAALKGLMLERRGMLVSAREGYSRCFRRHKANLLKTKGDNTGAAVLLFLGAWCGELTDQEAADRLGVLIGGDSGHPLVQSIVSGLNSESLGSSVRTMWLTPRGRKTAEEAYILESVSTYVRMRSLIMLIAAEVVNKGAFGGRADNVRQELIWTAVNRMFDSTIMRNEISAAQWMQLLLSWKGTLNILGWGGVAPTLEAEVRSDVAYLLGSRFARRNGEADATALFKDAVAHAPAGSSVAKAAAEDLRLLESKQGTISFTNDGAAVNVRIFAGGREVKKIECRQSAVVELPAGVYRLVVDDPEKALIAATFDVALRPTDHVAADIRRRWVPSESPSPVAGLVSSPAKLDAVGAWQSDTVQPRNSARSVAISPDDRMFAFATGAQIRVHETETLKLVRVYRGMNVGSVAWSSRGALAFTEDAKTIRVVTLDGKTNLRLAGHTGIIRALAWSVDGQVLAAAGGDKTIRLWNVDGSLRRALGGHESDILALDWSYDDKYLASAARDGACRIWTAGGESVLEFQQPGGGEIAVAWRPGVHVLATCGLVGDVCLTQVDGKTLPPISTKGGAVRKLAWNPAGNTLAVAVDTGVSLFSLNGDPAVQFKASSAANLSSITWARAGKGNWLATTCGNGLICRWQTDGKPLPSLNYEGQVSALSLSADGGRLAIGKFGGGYFLSSAGRSAVALDAHPRFWNELLWNPAGERAASCSSSERPIYIWNADGTVAEKFDSKTYTRRLAWSPDGKRLAGISGDGSIAVFDSAGGELARHSFSNDRVAGTGNIAWNNATAITAVHSSGAILRLGDDLSPLPEWKVPASFLPLHLCLPSPTGQMLLLGGPKGAAVVSPSADWEEKLADQKSFLTTKSVTSAAWARDGGSVAVGNTDSVVEIASPPDGKLQRTLSGHTRWVVSMVWSPDGGYLYSGSADATVRKWNAETGAVEWVAAPLPGKEIAVFSPGGQELFATPDAEQHLVYLVERPDESWDAITPAEFRKRIETTK